MTGTHRPHTPEDIVLKTDWIRRLSHSLIRDPEKAEDLAQETILRALQYRTDPKKNFSAWLRRVAKNLLVAQKASELRRRKRDRLVAKSEGVTPEKPALSEINVEAAIALEVQALREPYRTVIVLHFFHGLSPQEIAAQLKISQENAYKRIQRGLILLRKQLGLKYRGREFWAIAILEFFKGLSKWKAAAAAAAMAIPTASLLVLSSRPSQAERQVARLDESSVLTQSSFGAASESPANRPAVAKRESAPFTAFVEDRAQKASVSAPSGSSDPSSGSAGPASAASPAPAPATNPPPLKPQSGGTKPPAFSSLKKSAAKARSLPPAESVEGKTIQGILLDEDWDPVSGASILCMSDKFARDLLEAGALFLHDFGPMPLASSASFGQLGVEGKDYVATKASRDGEFSFYGPGLGPSVLLLDGGRQVAVGGALTVLPDGTKQEVFVLAPKTTVRGDVVDEQGDPVVGATIRFICTVANIEKIPDDVSLKVLREYPSLAPRAVSSGNRGQFVLEDVPDLRLATILVRHGARVAEVTLGEAEKNGFRIALPAAPKPPSSKK